MNLKKLLLIESNLSEVPEWLYSFRLEGLTLLHNHITHIDSRIWAVAKEINLGKNPIASFDLRHNEKAITTELRLGIDHLPERCLSALPALPSLESIYLSSKETATVDLNEDFCQRMPALRSIISYNSRLRCLPACLLKRKSFYLDLKEILACADEWAQHEGEPLPSLIVVEKKNEASHAVLSPLYKKQLHLSSGGVRYQNK